MVRRPIQFLLSAIRSGLVSMPSCPLLLLHHPDAVSQPNAALTHRTSLLILTNFTGGKKSIWILQWKQPLQTWSNPVQRFLTERKENASTCCFWTPNDCRLKCISIFLWLTLAINQKFLSINPDISSQITDIPEIHKNLVDSKRSAFKCLLHRKPWNH